MLRHLRIVRREGFQRSRFLTTESFVSSAIPETRQIIQRGANFNATQGTSCSLAITFDSFQRTVVKDKDATQRQHVLNYQHLANQERMAENMAGRGRKRAQGPPRT
ncbi:hypothetical protein HRR83_000615 [Exophiala dermatitidis]|uniref:Uncharacterized protein n=1 Tax=Exophiala dermatitidis TaxID=5970 RepID=A0AAN6F1R6_EXODE|nr:hypothetical protein HRR74_000618 [Exophiala dermatitidis]KAJ4528497.1 hypothetical protein HRR73_001120 [Exophiala dermatitidis]KAJ4529867.1 hypothetical protein HRR76_009117 [Exophiala dermatitidis]KAJ4558627.1 hypothetical protein HRR77_000616 [Exophiala dermatitidis]KAJ4581341.1 hypothetical protein HRR79_000381 [Exophiala dermatitidis]